MNKSESIANIAPALLKAQKATGSAVKDSQNPFFKSTYADLGAVMEACKQALNDNGITVLQPVGTDENGKVYVETVLLHDSGEYISDRMNISVKQDNDPQAQGSAITYARRYSLQSMVFIPAEDDDAEKAMSRPIASDTANFSKPPVHVCHDCGTKVADNVYDFSTKKYGRSLCFSCQQVEKGEAKPDTGAPF